MLTLTLATTEEVGKARAGQAVESKLGSAEPRTVDAPCLLPLWLVAPEQPVFTDKWDGRKTKQYPNSDHGRALYLNDLRDELQGQEAGLRQERSFTDKARVSTVTVGAAVLTATIRRVVKVQECNDIITPGRFLVLAEVEA